MTDPIADMFTRLRNAYAVGKNTVDVPYSNIKLHLSNKLKQLNYIQNVEKIEADKKQTLRLTLKYQNDSPAITKIVKISKPGRRLYLRTTQIKPVLSGHGSAILSTNLGILTGQEAKKKGVGGEIICQIY